MIVLDSCLNKILINFNLLPTFQCCSFFSGLPICCQTIEENKFQTDDYNKKNSRHTVNGENILKQIIIQIFWNGLLGFFKTVKTNRVFSKSSLVICLISLFLLNLLSFHSVLAAEERVNLIFFHFRYPIFSI